MSYTREARAAAALRGGGGSRRSASTWSALASGEIVPTFQPSPQLRPLLRMSRDGLDLLHLLRLLRFHGLPLGPEGDTSVLTLWSEGPSAQESAGAILHAHPRCPEIKGPLSVAHSSAGELLEGNEVVDSDIDSGAGTDTGERAQPLACAVCSCSFPSPLREFYQRAGALGVELDLTPSVWWDRPAAGSSLEELLARQRQSEEDLVGIEAHLPLQESLTPGELALLERLRRIHHERTAEVLGHESARASRERWEALGVGLRAGGNGGLAGEVSWLWARARALGEAGEDTPEALGERVGVEAHPECGCSPPRCAMLCTCTRACLSWVSTLVSEHELELERELGRSRNADGPELVAISRDLVRGSSHLLDEKEVLLVRHCALSGVVASGESHLLVLVEPWVAFWAQARLPEAGVRGWESAGTLTKLPGAWAGLDQETCGELASACLVVWSESEELTLEAAAEAVGWALGSR